MMPEHLTLGELVERTGGAIKTGPFGTVLKAAEYVAAGRPVVSVGEIGEGVFRLRPETPCVSEQTVEALPEFVLESGDIVFARKGAVDRAAWVGQSTAGWFMGSDALRVRLGPGVNSRFVSFFMRLPQTRRWLLQHAGGSTLASLSGETLARAPLVIPHLEAQDAIAEVLGALDDKIAANRALADAADGLISAMWDEACCEGARHNPFFDVIDVEFGEPFGGIHFSEPGVGRPLIRIRDLTTGSSQVWTSERRPKEAIVSPGDVLVGMDAEFRPHRWTGPTAVLNQRVMRVTSPTLGNALCREAVRAPLLSLEGMKSATTVIHLNKSDLQVAEVRVPSSSNLGALTAQAEALYQRALGAHLESRTLAELRDTLLPQLMSGRLRVRDAERAVEDVL